MTDLRDMQLLAALARQRHFARAAEECGISQSAFSMRIRNLEDEFGTPIVKRGNRFMGFTDEGLIALKWARQLLANADAMQQEMNAAKATLSGVLDIGAVPTALLYAAELPALLRASHPDLAIRIHSAASTQIQRALEDFSMAAGITYLDEEISTGLKATPLYQEKYILLAPPAIAPRKTGTITWQDAASLPLCLLTKDMRNRRILDDVFAQAGTRPAPILETNAFTAALAQVANGTAATVVPELLANSLSMAAAPVRLSLIDPIVSKPIGLVTVDREPVPPMLQALEAVLPR